MKKAFSLLIVLTLLLSLGISAFAVTANFTVGEPVTYQSVYTKSAGETIMNVNISSGSIPNGLTYQLDDARQNVYLTGTPTAAGSYSFILSIDVTDSNGNDVTRNVEMKGVVGNTVISGDNGGTTTTTVTPAPASTSTTFSITKQPGAENRSAGGYAIFIAKASGASNATWTLVAPDGGQYSIDTFKSKFPKITINVDNTVTDGVLSSTITLNNVSTDVSGYSAFVTFSDGTGSTLTSSAASMTITAASPTPTATAKPATTVAPTTKPTTTTTATTPTVAPTNTPSTAAAASSSTSPSPVPTDSPQTGSSNDTEVISHRSSSNVGAIIATVLVGLLTVAIAVVLILYVRGKLDLSWLENKLEKKHHDDDDDQ